MSSGSTPGRDEVLLGELFRYGVDRNDAPAAAVAGGEAITDVAFEAVVNEDGRVGGLTAR
jgi:hypothetical protein